MPSSNRPPPLIHINTMHTTNFLAVLALVALAQAGPSRLGRRAGNGTGNDQVDLTLNPKLVQKITGESTAEAGTTKSLE